MPENSMLARLDGLKIKYEEIGQQMTDPEAVSYTHLRAHET